MRTSKQFVRVYRRSERRRGLHMWLVAACLLIFGALPSTSVWTQRPEGVSTQALPAIFSGYSELFARIASLEGTPSDANSLLALAAESTMTFRPTNDRSLVFAVITVAYYNGSTNNQLRGASNNGSFYVIRLAHHPDKRGIDLVGIAYGNVFRWELRSTTTGPGATTTVPVLITSERVSSSQTKARRYEWDGSRFVLVRR